MIRYGCLHKAKGIAVNRLRRQTTLIFEFPYALDPTIQPVAGPLALTPSGVPVKIISPGLSVTLAVSRPPPALPDHLVR